MAYSNFTLKDIREKLGVSNKVDNLFEAITPIMPSEDLEKDLALASTLPVRSEKAKSEFIVLRILIDLMKRNERFFTIYSGEVLNADKEKGLTGECDFILAKDVKTFDINTPVLTIVEAKRHDIEVGIPQCAAQMIGAKYYNDEAQENIDTIHGCVTTGDDWVFLKLKDNQITIDSKKYYLSEIKKVLGIFQMIIDYYKETLK